MIYQPKKNVYLIKHTEKKKEEIIIKKSQCTILLYYPIERSKNARYLQCECACYYYILCPHTIYIYTLCTHAPIIPPFDIPREYIWKKEIIHQIYLSLYLANLLFFFSLFVSYLLSLSVSYFFPNSSKKKSFLVAPLSTLRNFCTVVLCLQYFVSFLKKQREKSYIWSIVYFWSLIYLWVPSPTSRRKKIWKYSIAKYIRENHLL